MSPIILEERWTPTTVETAFVLSLPSRPLTQSGGISIDLPLVNLGWTFALSLTPVNWQPEILAKGPGKKRPGKPLGKPVKPKECNWIPTTFSFRRHTSAIPWGNTSIDAQLSLQGECTPESPHNSIGSNLTPFGTMNVVLAQTSSLEVPTTCCTISSLQRTEVRLTVTISECPLVNGLFQARSGPVNESEVKAQLVRQSGDRVLSRSLATGKLFDVKFLTFSTSGNTGRLLPTHASLFVLEEHVNLSSCE